MRLAAQQILEGELVVGHGGVVDDGGQGLLGQRENLRLGERQCGDELDVVAVDASIHALGGFAAGILVVAHAGVAVELLDLTVQLGSGIQVRADGNGVGQLTGKGGHAVDLGIETFEGGFPGGVAFKHGRQIPLELRVQLAAFF